MTPATPTIECRVEGLFSLVFTLHYYLLQICSDPEANNKQYPPPASHFTLPEHLSPVPLIPSLTMVLDIWDTFLHCCWLILIIKIRHYNSQNTSLLWCSLFCSDDAWCKVLCPCVRTDWAPSLPPLVPALSSVWRPLEPPPPANTPHPPRS